MEKLTVNRTGVVRNPERDARIVDLAREGLPAAGIARQMGMSYQNVRYVLRREMLWSEPEHLDQVAHLALSGLGTEAIATQSGLTIRQVRGCLWLASGEWARLRASQE